MTAEHKAAIAEGRRHSKIIRSYLEALAAQKSGRGRRRTAAVIEERLSTIDSEAPHAEVLERVHLAQEQIELRAELESLQGAADLNELETAFIGVVAVYSERQGLTYAAWRAVGVPPAVLKRAGVDR